VNLPKPQRPLVGLDAVDVRTATYEGKMTDQVEFVDYAERRAYAELIVKLGGYFVPTERIQTPHEPIDRDVLIARIMGKINS
jgi:hypothetical protein